MLFLGKKFLSPPGISPESGGTCLLLGHWASCPSPGVQGEGEPRADGQGEVEGLALLCQCLEAREVSTSPTAVILILLLN